MKKKIELYVYFDNNLSSLVTEIEYENDEDFYDLANKEAEDFYNQLLENCVEYGWEEIND